MEDQPPHYKINVRVNLDSIPGRLQVRTQWFINMVTFGLQASEGFQSANLELPSTRINMRFSRDQGAWDLLQVRTAFGNWVLACGLRELLEEFNGALEESRQILAIWTLRPPVRAEDWNRRIVSEKRRFHRLGLPDKLDFLSKQYGVSLPDDKAQDLLSINRARNCLVHRGGVVDMNDIGVDTRDFHAAVASRRQRHPHEQWTNQQVIQALTDAGLPNALTVSWLTLQLSAEKSGETRILDPRTQPQIEAGSDLCVEVIRETAAFPLGSLVRFSADACSEIGHSLLNTAFALRDLVHARGKEMGVKLSDRANVSDAG